MPHLAVRNIGMELRKKNEGLEFIHTEVKLNAMGVTTNSSKDIM